MAHPAEASSKNDQDVARDVPAVVFAKVSLAFDDNVVLHKVSFLVRAGQMKILLGASGAGKTVGPQN